MIKVELHNPVPEEDSAPRFATLAEIEIAEQLRHQLEKRLLAPSALPPPLTAPTSDAPEESAGPRASNRHGHEAS